MLEKKIELFETAITCPNCKTILCREYDLLFSIFGVDYWHCYNCKNKIAKKVGKICVKE